MDPIKIALNEKIICTRFCHIVCLAAFLTLGCESLTTPEHLRADYPTVFETIDVEEQQILTQKYRNKNPGLCAAINEYGLNGNKICTDRDVLRIEIEDDEEDRMIQMAREFLEQNREFTNVDSAGLLEIKKSHGSPGCLKCDGSEGDMATISWKLDFKNQVYEGLEVKNSKVTVFLDAEKVFQVYGHWYENIAIPSADRLDYEAARESLVGKKLVYSDWSGAQTYVITKDSFGDYEDKVILPYETEQGLELRVCLVVSAGEMWHLFVDSTTGEFIHKEQLVVF